MKLDIEVGLCLGDIVLDGHPAPPAERGTAAPTLWPMSVVAKQSPISETAELVTTGENIFLLKNTVLCFLAINSE